jgi:hypothetical protein
VGVGYQASALHLITYLVVDESAPCTTEPPPGLPRSCPALYLMGPPRVRSPAIADIISWRDKLTIKYADQLGELLSWDEENDFHRSEDAAVSGDVLFATLPL